MAKETKTKKKSLPQVVKKKFGGVQEGSGRPPTILDERMLYKLAQSMLSVEAIANIMDTSADVIYARYSDTLHKGRNDRRHTLVQAMWQKGLEEKDTKMLIWLSKQHLGYKDIQPEEAQQMQFNIMVNEVPK